MKRFRITPSERYCGFRIYLAARLLRSLDRRRNFASATCGGKNLNRLAKLLLLMPERHEAFAWAGRPGKNFFVCVCLRLKYFLSIAHNWDQ